MTSEDSCSPFDRAEEERKREKWEEEEEEEEGNERTRGEREWL